MIESLFLNSNYGDNSVQACCYYGGVKSNFSGLPHWQERLSNKYLMRCIKTTGFYIVRSGPWVAFCQALHRIPYLVD